MRWAATGDGTAGVDRVLDVHAEVDDVDDHFQHGVDDGASAGLPMASDTCRRGQDVGVMLESMRLPGAARLGSSDEPSTVVRPGRR